MLSEKDIINVCVACDDNYAKFAGVVIASILNSANQKDELSFFILDGGISDTKKQEILSLKKLKDCDINFVEIDESLFDDYKKIKTHSYLTIPAYYRLKLPSLLPNIDKIIYLDCDTVVNTSLSQLFNANIDNFAIGAIRDINRRMLKSNPKYFNSGVLLINLKYWRANNIEEKLLQFTKDNIDNIKVGDQEVLNRVLNNEVKILEDNWNVQSSNFINRSSYTNTPKIIHFVAKNKPWKKNCFSYHKNLYYKYLQLTPWKLGDEELSKALKTNLFGYVKYRPFFWLRPRFYEALLRTYIFKGEN